MHHWSNTGLINLGGIWVNVALQIYDPIKAQAWKDLGKSFMEANLLFYHGTCKFDNTVQEDYLQLELLKVGII